MPPNSNKSAKDSDVALLQAVARGERRALEELYLGYHRRLARFLFRLAPRYESVEEIINDTFMVVWQHAAEFRGASKVSTWIIGIAYRTALNALRRNGDAHLQAADDSPEQWIDPTQETETEEWVARALQELPTEQRLTIELAYHMGHSVEEIATITECPVGTVKARMFHAREKLRHYLPALGGGTAGAISGLK